MQMVASPVLKAMLTAGMDEAQTRRIDMTDFSDLAIRQFLEYLYTGKLASDTQSLWVVQLWALGDKYLVPDLMECVMDICKCYITLENVIDVFVEAYMFKAHHIIKLCVVLINERKGESKEPR